MVHLQKTYSLDGFRLSDVLYSPKLKQPRHTHSAASLSFVLAGGYIENYGNRAMERTASTIVFHPPQESHAVDFQDGARILSVEIAFRKLADIREQTAVFDASLSHRNEAISHLGHRLHREFCRMDAFSALSIEGLILEILAEASRCRMPAPDKKSPQWLTRAKDFLHDNFSESVTTETLAEIADVHPVHLARVFRQRYDCTVGEYLRRLRVEFARRQIQATDLPLSEIALAAGFADQSHLNKTFKSLLNLTPSEYRKNISLK